MTYLHSKKIIHRDLKSANILMDEHNVPKISDFGLARIKTTSISIMTVGVGTPLWMAPEIMRGDQYNEKSDVYSFALVLWEMISNQLPYIDLNQMSLLMKVGLQGVRPTLPEPNPQHPIQLIELIKLCWKQEADQRLSFYEILQKFREMEMIYKTNNNNLKKEISPFVQKDSSALNSSKNLCDICFEQSKQILFQPCNHISCCKNCSQDLSTCPICRKNIQTKLSVYLS